MEKACSRVKRLAVTPLKMGKAAASKADSRLDLSKRPIKKWIIGSLEKQTLVSRSLVHYTILSQDLAIRANTNDPRSS
jgi:hypothetical protein